MRLWSIHPKYLDAKGLVALWREGLLAKKVLEGRTKGYKNHPQLARFKNSASPADSINFYLEHVYAESLVRGYNFDKGKIIMGISLKKIPVTTGQIQYEMDHLKNKLRIRDKEKFSELQTIKKIVLHPLFKEREGERESWEIMS